MSGEGLTCEWIPGFHACVSPLGAWVCAVEYMPAPEKEGICTQVCVYDSLGSLLLATLFLCGGSDLVGGSLVFGLWGGR